MSYLSENVHLCISLRETLKFADYNAVYQRKYFAIHFSLNFCQKLKLLHNE